MKNPAKLPSLKVIIRDRRRIIFEGDVKSLSSVNSTGDFDVLSTHANFVALIKDKVVINKGLAGQEIFEIKSGLINVDGGDVSVYVGVGEASES